MDMSLGDLFTRKIKRFEYDGIKSILTIIFNSGLIKKYCDVPDDVHELLLKADDPNHFYEHKIDGQYRVL